MYCAGEIFRLVGHGVEVLAFTVDRILGSQIAKVGTSLRVIIFHKDVGQELEKVLALAYDALEKLVRSTHSRRINITIIEIEG